METKTSLIPSIENLLYLPRFAAFLLERKLGDFVKKQFEYAHESGVPLLTFYRTLPEDQQIALITQESREFLGHLKTNQANEQIDSSIQKWMANELSVTDRDSIVAEDILLVNHVRKKAMLDLLPGYTTDTFEMIELIKEIDLFVLQSISAATRQYTGMQKKKQEENAHFIQKVAETIPGAVYVFDAQVHKAIYSNNKLPEVVGYTQAELNALGDDAISGLVHPNDQDKFNQQQRRIQHTTTDEPLLTRYRIRKRDGGYKWLANYESVFKRKANGTVWQIIGITLDVDKEQKAIDELHESEQQLQEVQDVAQSGNWDWDFDTNAFAASEKTLALLGMKTQDAIGFMQSIHPADKDAVNTAIETAMASGHFNCEYRTATQEGMRTIWARGIVEYKGGKAAGIKGTVMDISEHNRLLRKLSEADARHKQAEALVHIGNYAWDLVNGQIEWSEEMYRIYEWPISATLSYEAVLDSVHPGDRPLLDGIIRDSIASQKPYDFHYRMVTPSGKTKILHSRGNVEVNENGDTIRLVGTDQDVTEKQNLIHSLQKSEHLYKQVEQIADMGNWSHDAQTGLIEWTDQLYRIYGLEPQSEVITTERFLSLVHPDDRATIEQGIARLTADDVQDYTFRITMANGTEKWLRSIAQVIRNEKGEPIGAVGTEQNVTEKEALINRLKESERLYKQAQSLAHMGNWSYDLQTGKISWSDELFAIYELPPGSPPTQEQWNDLITPEERALVNAQMEKTVSEHQPLDIVHRINLPNGKTKILHRRGEVLYDHAGKPAKIVGTTQDVTLQYQTQLELKDSRNFIQKITDATPSIISAHNVKTGRYTYVSKGVEKLLGYSTDQVMEKGSAFFLDLVHPDDREQVMEKNQTGWAEADQNAQGKDSVVEFTCRLKHSNGSYRWFHTYGTVFDSDAAGKVEHVLNISLDVTDQKQAIETIREQEYFIQQIADASPTILYLFDVAAQSIAYINREAFFVLGYLPEEITEEGNQVTSLLYHPDDLPLLPGRQQSEKTFQQVDSMIQYECRMKHKDGNYRWLLVREIVFKTGDQGGITQIIGAALDITRRKEMERTILQNAHQLEQSNASLEEFAYVASHDLKEPLRKISTFGDRLAASQTDRLSDEGKIYLSKIIDASQRMQNMISDLLSISMISGNKGFERTSLQKIMEDTLQTLEYKIEQQKAVIRYGSLPEANVVPSQFRQLFQNLISNSLKFVREGVQPVITIESKMLTADEASAYQLRKAPAYLRLSFADNGIGFENEYAQKIFAIFQRLHGRSEYEGSGIGLAICKKIAEHHGGVIFAEGRSGEGACFTLIIPA